MWHTIFWFSISFDYTQYKTHACPTCVATSKMSFVAKRSCSDNFILKFAVWQNRNYENTLRKSNMKLTSRVITFHNTRLIVIIGVASFRLMRRPFLWHITSDDLYYMPYNIALKTYYCKKKKIHEYITYVLFSRTCLFFFFFELNKSHQPSKLLEEQWRFWRFAWFMIWYTSNLHSLCFYGPAANYRYISHIAVLD